MPARLARGRRPIQWSKNATASVSRTGGRTGSGATTASVKHAKIDASRPLIVRSIERGAYRRRRRLNPNRPM
jgi:hypothetical protein